MAPASVALGSMQRKVETFARGLRDAGLRRGDRLALWMPNSVEWIALLLAASKLGLTLVALNMRCKTEEVAYILKHSGAAMLVLAPRAGKTNYLAMLQSLVPEIDRAGDLASTSFVDLRHVVLSGNELLVNAQRIVDLLDETAASLAAPALDGRVRIGIPEEYGASVLSRTLRAFGKAHPNVEIMVQHGWSSVQKRSHWSGATSILP